MRRERKIMKIRKTENVAKTYNKDANANGYINDGKFKLDNTC